MRSKLNEYLSQRLGEQRANAILKYLADHQCELTICKPRISKLGDFRVKGEVLSIKINDQLNPYRFVLTLVHEIAHLKTYREYGLKPNPHGKEWKQNYIQLLLIWEIEQLFQKNNELEEVFIQELSNPKACSGIKIKTEKILRQFDYNSSGVILDQLTEGQRFTFRNRAYQKIENRRTRVLCLNLNDKRKYTIHKASEVILIN